MDRRTRILLVVVGILLSLATPVLADVILSGGKDVGQDVTVRKTNGPNVTFGVSQNFTNENPYQNSNEIVLEPWGTFHSNGNTDVRVDRFNGTWTNVSSLQVDSADLRIEINDKQAVAVGGGVDSLNYKDVTLDDGTTDLTYAASTDGTLSVEGLPSDQLVVLTDANGNGIASTTTDGSGSATFDVPSGTYTATMETATAESPSATVVNPPAGETIKQKEVDLTVDVSDPDFADPESENVTIAWTLDGDSVATRDVSANGEYTESVSGLTGGQHNWSVTVTDSYGNSDTVESSFKSPSTLFIYNESAPTELINSTTSDVTVQFIADDEIYRRTTSNGKVNMTGLPVDEEFIVQAETNGYRDRRIYIRSLVTQQRIYLLPNNVSASNVVFTLDDQTGRFSPLDETTLFVEKPLNISGGTQYQTVVSDQFSAANEIVVTLETGERYRLRVRGPTGETRVLGSYTAAGDDRAPLNIGRLRFEGGSSDGATTFNARMREEDGQRAVRVVYRDPSISTENLTLEVVRKDNESIVLRQNASTNGPFGRYGETIPVPNSAPSDVAYVVRYHAERTNQDAGGTRYVGDIPEIAQDLGVDPDVLSMVGYVLIAAVLGLTMIATPRFAGLPTVAVAVGLSTLGIVSINPLLLAGGGVVSILFAAGGGQ